MDNDIKNKISTINRKIKEINSLYHLAAGKSNISDGEISIWSILLNSNEEHTQQHLCKQLSLSKQTINSLISGMTKKGYVILEHVPGTRNSKVIRLSEKGMEYVKNKIMWIFEAEHKAMEGTDTEEADACISMLEKYIYRLRKEFTEKQMT